MSDRIAYGVLHMAWQALTRYTQYTICISILTLLLAACGRDRGQPWQDSTAATADWETKRLAGRFDRRWAVCSADRRSV